MSGITAEIVSHVWRYSRAFAYQISGLVLDPPKNQVQLTVFFNEEDLHTIQVIQTLGKQLPATVDLVPRHLDKPRLFRRAIGRNQACLNTIATSCVLLVDADYIYPGTVVDEIVECFKDQESKLLFPSHYYKQNSHELGDEYLKRQETPQILGLDPADFHLTRQGKAIGGHQYVNADLARQYGYLNGTKWLTPHNGQKMACCRCDRGARIFWDNLGYKFKDIPDTGRPWRIRHSVKGRIEGEVAN